MKMTAAAFLFGVALTAMAPCVAQDKVPDLTDMESLRKSLNADKKALVESVLNLTPAEAKKFWPIYDAYQRGLDASDRQRTVVLEGLIARDRPASDLYAKSLAVQTIAADEAEIKARRTLHNRVMRALPARKAARYLQLEAKARALQAYDIAVMFPLVR
jgi:hypothetical protein